MAGKFAGLSKMLKNKKKTLRGATGQSEPYSRPNGDEVKLSQDEKMMKMTKEANEAGALTDKEKEKYKKKYKK